jgi:hypothetical protein
MKRLLILLQSCVLALVAEYTACGADIAGRIIDAQTGEPIARARVTIHVAMAGGPSADLAISSDASGAFNVSNLPNGSCQVSGDKPGYLASNLPVVLSADAKPVPVVLRLTRQAVMAGSVVDENGVGVPLAFVQLFRPVAVNGAHQIQPANGTPVDGTGEFRIFGLAPGRYYVGANTSSRRVRNSSKLAYAPILYPGVTDINAAQLIDLQPGREESITIRLPSVPAYVVRGQVVPAGRFTNFSLSFRPQEPNRFPVPLNSQTDLDGKTGAFKISGVPAGAYILEEAAQLDGRQRRALKTVVVGDTDVEGILLEPDSLPEITGRVTLEGYAAPRGVVSSMTLQAARNNLGAQIEEDGSFRISDVPPDSYRIVVFPTGSSYVRSIRQGGRDVQYEGLVIGEFPPDPIEIDLGSHGATIEGALAVPSPDPPTPVVIALFRRVDERVFLVKQAYVNGFAMSVNGRAPEVVATLPAGGTGRFTMKGIAPGEYVLFAWAADAQIEYAEPGFLRQFDHFGMPVHVTEDAKLNVAIEQLLPRVQR